MSEYTVETGFQAVENLQLWRRFRARLDRRKKGKLKGTDLELLAGAVATASGGLTWPRKDRELSMGVELRPGVFVVELHSDDGTVDALLTVHLATDHKVLSFELYLYR